MDENIFSISEKNAVSAAKNSNGHNTSSVHSNGNGHYPGDGCDSGLTVSINHGTPTLLIGAVIIIWLVKKP